MVADVQIDENGDTQLVEHAVDEPVDGGFSSAEPQGLESARVHARSIVSFEDGDTLVLGPREERKVICLATLPVGETTEHLAFVMVDPGPEEMPVYSNSSTRIEVTFRIAARVLIIPGVRRVRRDADGNSRVTLERIIRPTYFVEFADTQAVIPAKDAEDPVLRVEGVLANRSNTYITPLIQAQLRNLTTRRIVEKVTLGHGLAFVMSSTNRRFSGAFTSALEPGHYEITVEVDLGDSSPPRRTQLALELTEPIVGRSQGPQGVVPLDNSKATVRLRPGERSAGRVQVTNNLGETVRVTPYLGSSSFAEWITFTPKSVVLAPGRTRTVRVTIRAPADAAQALEEVPVSFVPTTINGATFPDDEAPQFVVTLRVLPPPLDRRSRTRSGAATR